MTLSASMTRKRLALVPLKKCKYTLWLCAYFFVFATLSLTIFDEQNSTFLNSDARMDEVWSIDERKRNQIKKVSDFSAFLKHEKTGRCHKLKKFGGNSCQKKRDGDKQVCLDKTAWDDTNDCLIYSFGVGQDASFEEDFIIFKNDCEIHMFDPTVDEKELQEVLDDSTPNLYFHKYGVYMESVVLSSLLGNRTGEYTMFTYEHIRRNLGHEGRRVNYIKMDIESSEWAVIEQMLDRKLLADIDQLAIELHLYSALMSVSSPTWVKVVQDKWNLLNRLETEAGFKRIYYSNNDTPQCTVYIPEENIHITLCGEVLYIKEAKPRTGNNPPHLD